MAGGPVYYVRIEYENARPAGRPFGAPNHRLEMNKIHFYLARPKAQTSVTLSFPVPETAP